MDKVTKTILVYEVSEKPNNHCELDPVTGATYVATIVPGTDPPERLPLIMVASAKELATKLVLVSPAKNPLAAVLVLVLAAPTAAP